MELEERLDLCFKINGSAGGSSARLAWPFDN